MIPSFSSLPEIADKSPSWIIPDKSPLTSAMNVDTPIWLNDSAITFKVTVLPVPEAPAIKP